MTPEEKNYSELKELVIDKGIQLFGVADIEPLKKYFYLSDKELSGMKYGISMATVLSKEVLYGIEDRPTLLYKWHYRQANINLDNNAFLMTQEIMRRGYKALPVPASQIIDWEKQVAHVSHRLVAEAAGLGWRGRNNLIVNEKYGSQIRLITVLTDIPLKTDSPVEFGCGSCTRCISKCPAEALGEKASDYNFSLCYNKLKEFSKIKGIGQYICGVCVKACYGKREEE